jgi:peptide/nickel transport system ATP-binding protein
MAAEAILEVRNLRKVYRQGGLFGGNAHAALAGVSLALRPEDGKVLAIVGESGSGKTTLARILLRLVAADAGAISVAGHKIVAPGERTVDNRTLRRLVQPIFQNPFEAFSLQLPLEELSAAHRDQSGRCRDPPRSTCRRRTGAGRRRAELQAR